MVAYESYPCWFDSEFVENYTETSENSKGKIKFPWKVKEKFKEDFNIKFFLIIKHTHLLVFVSSTSFFPC